MRIGICAPARPIDRIVEAKLTALAAISFPDVDLVFHPQCYASDGHFAGPDAVRAAAFLELANDPAFDAVWFARGGYGSNRLLGSVMPRLGPAARHKTFLGYSDNGFLLSALYARRIGRPVHGPMPSEVNRPDGGACVSRSLAWLSSGARDVLEPGLGARPAAAFNIAILDALVGTPWLADLADHVLCLEEIDEPMYRIDRMFFTIAHATQLKGIAGIRLGMIKGVPENDPPWKGTAEEMAARWCGEMGVPYLGRATIGHDAANRVVPFGVA
jgi:muramoyltetrapeptide carboxypeptidase